MDDDALILTNGHCIGWLDAYEVLVHEPYETEVTLYGADDQQASTYTSAEIVYGTMYDTDMAILRLEVTYQHIKDTDGADALWLSEGRAAVGDDIAIASGFWEYITTCQLDGFVYAMQEGQWAWTDSLRFSQECVTYGGTSGSPVISVETGEIVGVNNTGYEGGEPCTTNNPCEIDVDGAVSTVPDGSYGQQTFHLYSCIDENFAIDLSRPGCALPVPRGVLELSGITLLVGDECDEDGALDAGETAILSVEIRNGGPVGLSDSILTIVSTSASVSFPQGAVIDVDPLDPGRSTTVDVEVLLSEDVSDLELVTFDVRVTDPESAVPEVGAAAVHRVNYDVIEESSVRDDFESGAGPWSTMSEVYYGESAGWFLTLDDDLNTVWYARDIESYGDIQLESPTLEVGGGDFVIRFEHRYQFEASGGVNWDGGTLEISTDDGDSWDDVEDFADVSYGGKITDESGNVLGGRRGFVDQSPDWPERSSAVLDFGTQFAGDVVLVRFRLGTDAAAGAFGWEIDNFEVSGLDNTPFSSLEGHDDLCGAAAETPADTSGRVDAEGRGCACNVGSPSSVGWMAVVLALGFVGRRRSRGAV